AQRGGELVERGRSRNKFADGEVLRQPCSGEGGSSRSLETRATGDGERGKHVGAVLLGGLHGAGRRSESPAVSTIEVRVWNVRMRRENPGPWMPARSTGGCGGC